MTEIETNNPELADTLPKNYQEVPNQVLVELIKLLDPVTLEGDAFGKVYEFMMGEFAMQEMQKGGEFYTPASIVRLIVEIIEPYHGRILDPACGSGGMFVHSADIVRAHQHEPGKELSLFGIEKTRETLRLAKMNACDAPASRGAYRLSRAAAPTSVYRPGNSLRTRMATTAPMHHRHQRTVAQAHQPSPNSGRRDPKATGGLAEALASRGRRLSWLLSGLLLRRHSHYHRLHHLEIRFPKMVFDDLHRTGAGEAVNCRMIN